MRQGYRKVAAGLVGGAHRAELTYFRVCSIRATLIFTLLCNFAGVCAGSGLECCSQAKNSREVKERPIIDQGAKIRASIQGMGTLKPGTSPGFFIAASSHTQFRSSFRRLTDAAGRPILIAEWLAWILFRTLDFAGSRRTGRRVTPDRETLRLHPDDLHPPSGSGMPASIDLGRPAVAAELPSHRHLGVAWDSTRSQTRDIVKPFERPPLKPTTSTKRPSSEML